MSDYAVDRAVFAFLAACVGDFVRWPQCTSVSLQGDNDAGRLSGVIFKARSTNPVDRTAFKVIVMNDNGEWWARIVQVSNHILSDERGADRGTIVHAVNRFMELAGMGDGVVS